MNRLKSVIFGMFVALFAFMPMGLKANDQSMDKSEMKTELAYRHYRYRSGGPGFYFYYGTPSYSYPYYYNRPYYYNYYGYPYYRNYYYYY